MLSLVLSLGIDELPLDDDLHCPIQDQLVLGVDECLVLQLVVSRCS